MSCQEPFQVIRIAIFLVIDSRCNAKEIQEIVRDWNSKLIENYAFSLQYTDKFFLKKNELKR